MFEPNGTGLRTDCVYRILEGMTHVYAVSPNGVGAYYYDSMKQVERNHGPLPLVIVKREEFDAIQDALR